MSFQELPTIDSGKYKQLSDVEHVCLRAELYTGSRKPANHLQYLMFPDGKIYPESITIVPATLTLANELIDNSYDEYRRCMNENREHKITRIDVTINLKEHSLLVTDDGGIPVVKHAETGLLLPTLLFGRMRSSSNYTDSRGDMSGLNGVGAVLVNIFSDCFRVTTCDGQRKFDQTWRNNLSIEEEPIVTETNERFSAFYAKFSENEDKTKIPISAFNVIWARAIEMRCCELAAMGADEKNPLHIYWNVIHEDGTEWHNDFCFKTYQEYLEHWPNSENMIYDEQYRFKVAMTLSSGQMESISLVNAVRCDYGTHVNAYLDACAWHIRNYVNHKFKVDITPSKIKSYIRIISTWRIDNPVFKGQTKEELATVPAEFGFPCIPSEQFIKKLLRSNIVTQIVEELHQKIYAQRKAEIAAQQRQLDKKSKKNLMPEKLYDASNAGKSGCELFVVEGDSAAGGFKKMRNAEYQGVFSMFGKSCGNTLYWDEFRVLQNKAWSGLIQALGLSFTKDYRLRYDKIILSQDADYDGSSIFGLMLVFFHKFFPELIQQGKIYRLITPIGIATKGDDIIRFYSYEDMESQQAKLLKQRYTFSYHKGLASLSDDEYEEIMKHPVIVKIVEDDFATDSINAWFGNDSTKRKELMGLPEISDIEDLFDIEDEDVDSEYIDSESLDYNE